MPGGVWLSSWSAPSDEGTLREAWSARQRSPPPVTARTRREPAPAEAHSRTLEIHQQQRLREHASPEVGCCAGGGSYRVRRLGGSVAHPHHVVEHRFLAG